MDHGHGSPARTTVPICGPYWSKTAPSASCQSIYVLTAQRTHTMSSEHTQANLYTVISTSKSLSVVEMKSAVIIRCRRGCKRIAVVTAEGAKCAAGSAARQLEPGPAMSWARWSRSITSRTHTWLVLSISRCLYCYNSLRIRTWCFVVESEEAVIASELRLTRSVQP